MSVTAESCKREPQGDPSAAATPVIYSVSGIVEVESGKYFILCDDVRSRLNGVSDVFGLAWDYDLPV